VQWHYRRNLRCDRPNKENDVNQRERLLLIIGLVAGILIGAVGITGTRIGALAQDELRPTESIPAAEDIVSDVGPSVVTVINEQRFADQGDTELQPVGSGTGFILDEAGHIVTNAHVVDGGDQFEVIFADGSVRGAELIGADPLSDLAVVKVDGDLPGVVTLGDSEELQPGQPVLAIGSPLGAFTNTVTRGIVSAIGRDFPGSNTYTNLIQHDAAINPGNSGGPLFDFNGNVIGVNTLGIPTDDSGEPVQGLFFAIPSNTVDRIAAKLIEDGEVVYPYFGIEFRSVTQDVVAQNNLDVDSGVIVLNVTEGGPAEEAGIQAGDIVTAIGGIEINRDTSFSEALFAFEPGATVEVSIVRDGEEMTVEVTLAERPDNI
jgi:2-alkenal reductase